jgi:hypothetical protein
MSSFMISLEPAQILVTRASRKGLGHLDLGHQLGQFEFVVLEGPDGSPERPTLFRVFDSSVPNSTMYGGQASVWRVTLAATPRLRAAISSEAIAP